MCAVNENNPDELFRQAAKDFRLNSTKPDWQTLSEKMQEIKDPGEDHQRRRSWSEKFAAVFTRVFKKKVNSGALIWISVRLLLHNPTLSFH
jgi:hypothetical protein